MIFCNKFCLILLLQIFVYIFSIYLCIFVCANIFGTIVLKPRFKTDVVIMIIWSIVIIVNSVLILQVSTTSLPHDCRPCERKGCVHPHLIRFIPAFAPGRIGCAYASVAWSTVGISSTPGDFLKHPILVRVCSEQTCIVSGSEASWTSEPLQ
jgi:hypothetical protein